jgi:hypothetical protein
MSIQRNEAQRQVSQPQSMPQQQIRLMSNPMNNIMYQVKSAPQPAFSILQSWEEISPVEMQHQTQCENQANKSHSKPRSRGSRARPSKSHY